MNHHQPIGIFDSGLGGLTVLKTLCDRFPHENFIYLGDLARLPYGNKSPETIKRYGQQILARMIQAKVKHLIIACNTASSVFLNEDTFEGIPLSNVIEPGALAALKISKTKKIAVIGTSTTINSKAYQNVLKKFDPSVEVFSKACPLFVPLAEEGWVNDPITQEIANRYLESFKGKVDTIILGCTHYPILKEDIKKVMGESISLVESGHVLSETLAPHLHGTDKNRLIKIWTTDMTDHFKKLAKDLMIGHDLCEFELIVL
jgi:glutamate racemase